MEFLRSFLRRHLAGKPVAWLGRQMSAVFSGCTRFQVKEILSLLLTLERQQKRFLKTHFEFAYFSFFLIHLERKR